MGEGYSRYREGSRHRKIKTRNKVEDLEEVSFLSRLQRTLGGAGM